MRRFNLEQMVRNIVQDELAKAFNTNSSSDEIANNTDEEEEGAIAASAEDSNEDEDPVTLPTIDKAPRQSRGRAKNRGRGRVTKSTDGRLRANRK